MTDEFIDYGKLIDDAMHVIVRHALQKAESEGLPGKHHFFISFLTQFPGVMVSDKLRGKYPDEMTIVLQYQFESLIVEEHGFSVILSFDNIKEKIVVPFSALTAFADPSVKFGLQFRHLELEEDDEDDETDTPSSPPPPPSRLADAKLKKAELTAASDNKSDISETKGGKKTKGKRKKSDESNVVKLDSFRPKKKK